MNGSSGLRTDTGLLQLMEEVARASSLEQIYASALACLETTLDVERSSLLVLDPAGVMRFVAWKGLSEDYRRAVEGHSPWEIDDRDPQPVLVPDAGRNEALAPYRELFASERIAALAFIPLRFSDRLLGKFMLYYAEPHHFTQEEIAVARTIAGHVSFALEHYRIANQLKASHETLEKRLASEAEARRRAEKESELRRAIEDSVLAGIAAVDNAGVQTYVNPAFCRMVGFSPEELVGARPPFVYWPEEERETIEEAFRRTIAGEAPPEGFELRFCRRNGQRFDALVHLARFGDGSRPDYAWLASVHDITERKRDQERLQGSESWLRLALEAGRMGAWEWDIPSGKLTWSPELEAIHGLAPGEFPGTLEAFERCIHPQDREVLRVIERSVQERREKYELEYRIVRPDLEVRWLEARCTLISDGGRSLVLLGICSDVTRRKRLEEANEFVAEAAAILSSSLDFEQTLKSLTRLAVPRIADWCTVHLVEPGGDIVLVEVAHSNPSRVEWACELQHRWPIRPDAPVGIAHVIRSGEAILEPKVTPEILAAASQSEEHLRTLQELELHSAMVVPLRARDRTLGAITFVSAESKREYGPEDLASAERLASRAALAIDNARLLSERESARVTAERAAGRLRILAEASEALASSLDYDTTLKTLANFAASTVADYCITYSCRPDGTIRRVGLAHRHPAKQALVEELVRTEPPRLESEQGVGAIIRTGEALLAPDIPDELLVRAVENDDHREVIRKLAPRSSIIVPLIARGRTLGAVALATTDDSGRRYTEEDLLLAKELASRVALLVDNVRLYHQSQEAIRARDELMQVVSHDLKNPLYTILLSCDVLDLDTPPDKKTASAEAIRRSAKQMDRLITDLLEISRIEAGGLSLRLQPVDIGSVLSDVIHLFSPMAEEKSVRLEHRIRPGLPPVEADRDRLLQVLSNLVSNAIKFGPRGCRVSVSAETDDALVRISVADTGPGIPEEEIPHIFDRFWQADGKARQGAGLGLAIANGIVEAHGSKIHVESRPGAGSTFSFALKQSAPEHDRPRPNQEGGEGSRVASLGLGTVRPKRSKKGNRRAKAPLPHQT